MKCYFQDGEKVSYNDLWKALRIKYNLDGRHNKTLPQLYPDSFIGVVPQKISKYKWENRQAFRSMFLVTMIK